MQRESELKKWFHTCYPQQEFVLSFAAADADFRRYFRATFTDDRTVICMDAPPDKMSILPYIKVQKLFQALNVPEIYHLDTQQGFMALEDFGNTPYLAALQQDKRTEVHKVLLLEAIDELIKLQLSSQAEQLPLYDEAVLKREMQLFPEWYVQKELGLSLTEKQQQLWQQTVNNILPVILSQPLVYVHRDFIVRNIMLTCDRPGILDFQDALYGPITYDLVSLLRDAFIEWDEEFILDIVIRYWEKARAAGLPVRTDFDQFYRDFEWMGVQRHLKVAGIFARLYYRDGKDKYRGEIHRFLKYLRKTSRRYGELRPLLQLITELIGSEEAQTGYTF
ncbi:aminoglycoside phosphotransferase [Snodgrassella alvi]|uniref:N-acetylmuramate/N-acetylglucosamine kinase AmgK n=1 Tax=Snodgrassella alvi TaxID=1196083 RepID=UPI000A0773ED|nr:phosphotransferase [Snodgrassella alvi]ORF00883.1 aminoglycoside phosphotransferase [Snodgrassella alvi]ORF07714.1 aminoglycoside phosphotransferase [Snodgrassella alvi]ORF10921.1 aminoglycoside phosphotransferase [Snodgrassella alvi]ORF12527.1 aminoglycoside phosphotransferase [Snodgrassella alvi]ORF18171.1 aminoglycoside phosphotransferase [Snodgrassella alvi]